MSNITAHRGFTPQTMTEAMEFSERLSNSQMVPKNYQGKPTDILVAMQWGFEIGLAPMQALQNISVINGKPSVYGDAAMALVQASAVCEDVEEYFEGEGTPNPVAVCIAHRKGRKPVTYKFSVEDAKRAGLWGKQGPWSAYPKRMLQMRARGFALRDAFPDVLKGLITAEEAQDYPEDKPIPVKDITPANPLDTIALPESIEENYECATEVEVVQEDEPVEIQGSEVEVPESEVPQAHTHSTNWLLYIPNKEPVHLQSLDEWLVEYNKLADTVATAGKAAPRKRMTALRELREANEASINKIPNMARIVLTQAYQTRLKHLGAKMREEEGSPDTARVDNGPQRQA